ncbi:MAG: NBR1-Ig-like domain-containing protein [Caldilineaceae bacterium]
MPKSKSRTRHPRHKTGSQTQAPMPAAIPTNVNQATAYAVRIANVTVTTGQPYWQVIRIRHLTPQENHGQHNVFVDALDEAGQRYRDPMLRIGWTWEGRRPDEDAPAKLLDKPDNEPAGNVDLYPGQHLEVWIEGDGLPSDRVSNMHSEHPDEPGPQGELGNSFGHHSYHVVFQRARKQGADQEEDHRVNPISAFRFEAWPTEFREINQGFGNNPSYYRQFQLAGHEGVDIKAPLGSRIFSVAAGTVKYVHRDANSHNYGIHIRLEHADGYETIYAHLQTAIVQEGQAITAGQAIGLADHTGNVVGDPADHLHLTLKHGSEDLPGYRNHIIDPTPFLQRLLAETSDEATYVRDRIADGSQFKANQTIDQSWTLRNSGQTTWGDGYVLALRNSEALGAPPTLPVPTTAPGAEATIQFGFRAPATPGHYRSEWQLRNATGQWFGETVWLDINVAKETVVVVRDNKLGFYLQNAQDENGLWDAVSRVQPPVILVHADGFNDLLLNQVRDFRAPDAFVIGRWYLDEDAQRAMLESEDPEGSGRSFAEQILTYDFGKFSKRAANGRLLVDAWMSLNEAIPGPASSGFGENRAALEHRYEHYDRFQVAFRQRLQQEGIEAVAFNFAAGNFTEAAHYLGYFPRTLAEYTYLGFHEYGWPALFPGANTATSAGIYRRVMEGVRAHLGQRHKVVITEAGLTRAYGHPENPDEGWLNTTEPLDENRYWESLAWYNQLLSQDNDTIGACLYQVGHIGRWESFRHLGRDNQNQDLHLVDRLMTLRSPTRGLAGLAATRPLDAQATPIAPITLTGKVTNNGKAVTGATVRLLGDLNTLGSMRGVVIDRPGAVTWSRRITGFSGTLRNAWDRFVASEVAGLTWQEFSRQIWIANPQLSKTDGKLKANAVYFLPENSGTASVFLWDRIVTGYTGTLRHVWLDRVQGKVVGINYASFRRQMLAYNPSLATTQGQLNAERSYLLPRTVGADRYALSVVTSNRGRFRFVDLTVGSYQLEVSAANMQPFKADVELYEDEELELEIEPLLTEESVPRTRGTGGGNFIGVIGREFVVNGQILRFIGVNLRGLVYYGAGMTGMLQFTETRHREECVQQASDMGAKVVRVFLPCINASAQQTIDLLHTTLDVVGSRGLYLLPALVDFYKSTDFRIPGDDGYYAQLDPNFNIELLKGEFYRDGYRERYLPFVTTVVEAFKNDPRIFAWEIGNELKYEPAFADPDRNTFIGFMLNVARQIKGIDPNHLVTTGMISTSHASLDVSDLWQRLYGGNEFDFITVHCYNEEYENKRDHEYARTLNKPFIIEEAGFGNARPGNRVDQVRADMDRWFGFGASGYMQWGFMPVGNDIGDGDTDSGMDRQWHAGDFDGLFNLYRERAAQLKAETDQLSRPTQPVQPVGFQLNQQVFAQTIVNVRKSPGTQNKASDDVLGQLAAGASVTITGTSKAVDGLIWWPIHATLTQGNGVDGWAAEMVNAIRLLDSTPPATMNRSLSARAYG